MPRAHSHTHTYIHTRSLPCPLRLRRPQRQPRAHSLPDILSSLPDILDTLPDIQGSLLDILGSLSDILGSGRWCGPGSSCRCWRRRRTRTPPSATCSRPSKPSPATKVQGSGFRVQGSGVRVQGLGLGVRRRTWNDLTHLLSVRCPCVETPSTLWICLRVWGLVFQVQYLGFRV